MIKYKSSTFDLSLFYLIFYNYVIIVNSLNIQKFYKNKQDLLTPPIFINATFEIIDHYNIKNSLKIHSLHPCKLFHKPFSWYFFVLIIVKVLSYILISLASQSPINFVVIFLFFSKNNMTQHIVLSFSTFFIYSVYRITIFFRL